MNDKLIYGTMFVLIFSSALLVFDNSCNNMNSEVDGCADFGFASTYNKLFFTNTDLSGTDLGMGGLENQELDQTEDNELTLLSVGSIFLNGLLKFIGFVLLFTPFPMIGFMIGLKIHVLIKLCFFLPIILIQIIGLIQFILELLDRVPFI